MPRAGSLDPKKVRAEHAAAVLAAAVEAIKLGGQLDEETRTGIETDIGRLVADPAAWCPNEDDWIDLSPARLLCPGMSIRCGCGVETMLVHVTPSGQVGYIMPHLRRDGQIK